MTGSADNAVAVIARRQRGLVTRLQAREAGLRAHQVDHRLASGRWRAVRRGVLAINGVPPAWEQEVLAACLAGGPAVYASHLTAARLWGIEAPRSDVIDVVTLVDRRVRQPGVRHHRSPFLWQEDVTEVAGVPVTTAARTLVDVGGVVPEVAVGRIVDEALRRGIVALDALRTAHERVARGPGRRPHVAMGLVLEERLPGYRAGGSERELEVARVLVAAGLPATVRQHEVVVGPDRFVLDHAYPDLRIALEFDGWQHHHTFTAFHRDRDRWRRLAAEGWTIVPVTSRTTPDDLVADVRRLLAVRRPA